MTTDLAQAKAEDPVPTVAGTFAIYELDDGSAVLVIGQPDPEGGPDLVSRKVIPAMLMKMIRGGGGPLGRQLRGMWE